MVTATRQRIKNIFDTAPLVQFSISGGKDSACLNDILYKMCMSGEIDKDKLVIDFVDEEAIYPCVERTAKNMRNQWLSIGVEFRWWCIEVRHFNCFNQLQNDESFICWDRYKKDVWVREMPKFALTSHPLFNPRAETYQAFLPRLNSDRICLIGTRVAESIQRAHNIAHQTMQNRLYPIYDWSDSDVWLYIKENNVDIPDAYLYMYQVGIGRNRLRISQFFSIDTATSLVQMCEFYPDLFEKICKREPNAYLAMLYYDTELFRRQRANRTAVAEEEVDYKEKVLEYINNDGLFTTANRRDQQRVYKRLIMLHGALLDNRLYKDIYNALVGGDPKKRSFRAIFKKIFRNARDMECVTFDDQ